MLDHRNLALSIVSKFISGNDYVSFAVLDNSTGTIDVSSSSYQLPIDQYHDICFRALQPQRIVVVDSKLLSNRPSNFKRRLFFVDTSNTFPKGEGAFVTLSEKTLQLFDLARCSKRLRRAFGRVIYSSEYCEIGDANV